MSDRIIELRFNAKSKYSEYFIEDLVRNIISYSDEEDTQKFTDEIIEKWNKDVQKTEIKNKEDLIKLIRPIIKEKLPK